MPEIQTPPADGIEGGADGGDAGAQGSGGQPDPKPEAKFTQTDLERIVTERVARAKPADYEEAKAALEEKRKRDEGEKTELQKLTETTQTLKQERDTARTEQAKALRSAEIRIEALKQGGDEELIAMALAEDPTVKVEDGKVVGAKEAVEALLERKPNLKTGGTRQSAGEFGGNDGTTVAQKVAALRAKGDPDSMREARAIEIEAALAAG